MCIDHNLSPSYCYKHFKCRCLICGEWKRRVDTIPNREKAKEISRLWRLNNPERSRQNAKNYQKNNPEQVFKWQLKKYNLTLEDYTTLIQISGNRCQICGGTQTYKGKIRLAIDHDKISGKVRGLLCNSCNLGIGHLQHKSSLLQKAIQYLNE